MNVNIWSDVGMYGKFLVVWMPDWLYRIPWSCALLCLLLAVAGFYFRLSAGPARGAHWHVLCHGCRCKLQHQTCEGLGHGCACHCWHDGGFIVVLFICSFYCFSPRACWVAYKHRNTSMVSWSFLSRLKLSMVMKLLRIQTLLSCADLS